MCILLAAGCFHADDREPGLQGPGSETVGMQGAAAYSGGRPAAGAKAIARPAAWFPDTAETAAGLIPGGEAVAGADGRWRIAPLAADSYFVEVRGDSGRTALVAVGVSARGLANAPVAVLRPVGTLTGTVRRGRPSSGSVFLRLAGLDRLTYLAPDSTRFRFTDLPAGRYALQALSGDPALGATVLSAVEVRPGETGDVGEIVLDAFGGEDYSAWKGMKAVAVRAGPLGADLDSDVADIALPVRLQGGAFPFDSAAAGGADLRFSDAAGRHLHFEIARWDAAAKEALIWVRLDTVRAGDDTQSIRLHYGKAGAPAMGSGPAVFPAAGGWRGAWHLDAEAPPMGWADASGQLNPLTADAAGAAVPLASPLGGGAGFKGGLLSSTKSLRAPQAFTLSLWFQATGGGKLIGFETGYLSRNTTAYDRHLWIEPDGSVHFGVYIADPPEGRVSFERMAASAPGYADGEWHHVAATQDPKAGMALYLDGALAATNADAPHAEDISGYWILGGGRLGDWSKPLAGDARLKGSLDEVTVAEAARSADWIKLAHASQKPGSNVLLLQGR